VTVIRPAEPADARAIAEVHVASWRWAYAGDLPQEVLDALSVDERARFWTRAIPDPAVSVVVAAEVDRIVGFASTGATRDVDALDRTGELFAIYLDAAVAGTGVGSALLERAERDLRDAGYERATLWVLASNDRARRFYERHGWVWDGTTSRHDFECANRPIVRYARRPDMRRSSGSERPAST
jgi:ribosomal protein S18 acetylase RimI-like enzyme